MTNTNTTSPPSPSFHADQPVHVAGQPVDLVCMDLEARDTDDGFVVRLTKPRMRNARMDAYGVGYEVEMTKSKSSNVWMTGAVSRRRFGLDNFNVQAKFSQMLYTSSKEDSAPDSTHLSRASVTARAWFWAKDEDKAVLEIKKALSEVMGRLRAKAVNIEAQLAACTVRDEPEPTPKKAIKP